MAERRTVAVVGGGIAGLAAAWELAGGADRHRPGTPRVIVLEAAERLGGKLRTEAIGDRLVDVGPDGFLGRRPEALTLCRQIGIEDELVPIGASGAAVWTGRRLRPLPAGLALGVPTRLLPVARSRILGVAGTARLARDALVPRRNSRGPLGDRAIGPLVARKLGPRVVDSLVDPLVGGIHAGRVDDMSAAAVYPVLLAVSHQRGSMMRALRRASTAARDGAGSGNGGSGNGGSGNGGSGSDRSQGGREQPAFWSLQHGVGSLVEHLEAALVARGVEIRTADRVEVIERSPEAAHWTLGGPRGRVTADGIVLAVPAGPAARLLAPHDAEAASVLGAIDHAPVTVVTLVYPVSAAPGALVGTGFLIPRVLREDAKSSGGDRRPLVTACTYLGNKWPHLARPGEVLLRASVGRSDDARATSLDDQELSLEVAVELSAIAGLRGGPATAVVTRWPDALPQYRVHHLLRVQGIEAAAKRLPAFALAGAAYRGVGIPACIASGSAAARSVLEALASPAPPAH